MGITTSEEHELAKKLAKEYTVVGCATWIPCFACGRMDECKPWIEWRRKHYGKS